MLEFRVTGDVRAIEKHLTSLAKDQVPFATALALTKTAQFVQRKIIDEMSRAFDRPKKYTLNSTWVRPATKRSLWAEVKIKDAAFKSAPPIRWISHNIRGGGRKRKGFESALIRAGAMPANSWAVPSRFAMLDGHGNLATSEINRMLSDLKARRDPLQNSTSASRGRRKRSRTKRPTFYFSTYPVTPRTVHLKPGVYKRTHFGFGAAIKPVILFTGAQRYRKRFRFFEIAEQTGRMRWPIEFGLAMRQAMRTAR